MFDRVIVLGIDGLDPHLIERYMQAGDLPNLSGLRNTGSYAHSATSNPPQSPVAWSDIGTGTDSGTHDVFDFILRHPKKYLPDLSILRANRQNLLGSREKMFERTCKKISSGIIQQKQVSFLFDSLAHDVSAQRKRQHGARGHGRSGYQGRSLADIIFQHQTI
jgi:hypothetical protein